jgi:hypothetical protein
MQRIADCIIRRVIPQPTEWQRIGDQINAAMIFALLAKKVIRGVLGQRSSNNERLGSHFTHYGLMC